MLTRWRIPQVGTTVTLRNLFEPLPVRRREFLRNLKRDYGRLLALVQAYALTSVGVRLTCSNQNGKGCVPECATSRVPLRPRMPDTCPTLPSGPNPNPFGCPPVQ